MLNLSSNGTFNEASEGKLALKMASDILTMCILVLLMFVMGADIKFKQIIEHLKVPISIIMGMLCQFVVMPLIGFSLSQALQLHGPSVLGVLLISCCPGGALSNLVTYLLNGDLSLSVTMTTVSTILAIGLMPFNFWMYGHWVDVGNMVIPYKDMIISVLYVSIPAALGVLFKWKFSKVAAYVTKVGSTLIIFLMVTCLVLYNLVYPDLLPNSHWRYVVAVLIMPFAGFMFGFGLSFICKRNIAICKTIGAESGIQNVAIAFGVLAITPLSFEEQKTISLFPMLYGITMTTMGIISGLIYQISTYFCKHSTQQEKKVYESPTEEIKETNKINMSEIFIISAPMQT